MGKREEYTSCMVPYMKGGGEGRKERFCVGAKICSGKAQDESSAKTLCAEAAAEAAANPKPPKKKRPKKVCTLQDLDAITTCVVENIDVGSLTSTNMTQVFGDALRKCSGGPVAKQKITTAKTALSKLDPESIKVMESLAKFTKQFSRS
ncbi:hypothetical protein LCGC14_1645190 [marine sediment metagenome]|uniref:Uncharacterized protein n=1 Tax=marine sediment metagenome TaxID=412755 RepID=A0A0F9HZ73_9ZZZZ